MRKDYIYLCFVGLFGTHVAFKNKWEKGKHIRDKKKNRDVSEV